MKGELYMKLNEKGKAAFDKWSKLWDFEVAEQEMIAVARNDYSAVEYGWSCTDYLKKNITDEAEQMCMVHEDDVFYFIRDNIPYIDLDEEWNFGVTKRDFLILLATEYLVMEDSDDYKAVDSIIIDDDLEADDPIPFYTSANPWDAPGMKVSDFL